MPRRPLAVLAALLGLVGLVVLPGCGTGTAVSAGDVGTSGSQVGTERPSSDVDPDSGLPWVVVGDLPDSAQQTLALVDAGGPFPYEKDGSTFGNREGLLPDEAAGFYAEFTVPKPGEDDRGPWQLVVGDGGEIYWTADHYSSFARVWR